MTSTIKKTLSSFLAVCMLFGLFIVLDQPITVNAAEALSNVSTISATSVQKGQSVQVNAIAKGGTGFYQYAAYSKLSTDAAWTTEQGYGANSIIMISFSASGSYDVRVTIKDSNGEVATKDFAVSVGASAGLANKSTLSATSIALGSSITVNAKAEGGTAPYLYGVYYKKASAEKWSTAQGYKSNDTISIKPSAATTYDVKVKVKDSAGKIVAKSFTVNVTKALSNTASISSELISLGQSVTVTCAATGGKTPYLFGVYYKLTTVDTFTTAQAYNANKTVAITPKKAGTYDIKVKVKDAANKIVSKSFKLSVVGSSALTNTSSLSATKITLGNPITVNASATGGSAPYQYALYYRSAEVTTWKAIQSYKTNSTIQYKPTLAGKYELCIKVKDSKGTIVKKYVDFTAETNIVNTTTMSADTISTNDNLTFKCSATGGTGSYQYAVYMKKAEETEYITYRAFSTNTTEVMTFSDPGNYDLCVKVKDSNGAIVKKYFKLTVTSGHTGTKYDIVYYVDLNDSYLQKLNIVNDNPDSYYSGETTPLNHLMVEGYNFVGWFTAQTGGTEVTEITKGSTGKKTLYAHWEKEVYIVDFDSPDVPVDSVTYTVDKGVTLRNPSWFGYTFVGWSMDGKIVSRITPGTTGNITLHANWTSNRNRARAVKQLAEPDILEDMINGRYLFVYEIGTIENVPISLIEYFGNSQGIDINREYEYSTSVDSSYAENIAQSIANATTKSSSWTLSEEWNSSTQATDSHDEQIGKTKETTNSNGTVQQGKYYISNSSGGSTASSISGGGSSEYSSKVTEGESVGINNSYSAESSKSKSATLSSSTTEKASVEAGVEAGGFGVKASVKASAGVEMTDSESKTVSSQEKRASSTAKSRSSSTTDEYGVSGKEHWDVSNTSNSTWNATSGYEASTATSVNKQVSNSVSSVINDRYSYSVSDSLGEKEISTTSSGESQELKNEYATTVAWGENTTESVKKKITFKSDRPGYYRLVNAGTVHVFAVVGYDIATNAYFTYTYNVLDKERHEYLDYSMDNALFNDCENAVLPFEVPIFVSDYIDTIIGRSDNLTVDADTGYITEYTGDAEYVVIPQYISVENDNFTYSAVRIKGLDANVFRNNKTVKGVFLSKYITSIPDNAFDGCSSLELIIAPGVDSIGNYAFRGCSSLKPYKVDQFITKLGNKAFDGVPEIVVFANKSAIVDAALKNSTKRITINLAYLSDGFNDKTITADESVDYFALMSNDSSYNNLKVESNAKETLISNIVFKNNSVIPMKISSPIVTLSKVKVENNQSVALVLSASETNLKLFGTITLGQKDQNTVVSKNVILSKAKTGVAGTLKVYGKYMVCGTVTNQNMMDITEGQLIPISESQFDSMLTSCMVSFDANGGSVSTTSQPAYYGQTYGTLPTPTRANYNFDGWFTATSGGTQVTSDTTVTAMANHTLYAHWSPKQYQVTFNGNGGTAYSSSKTVTYNTTYGTLPNAQRDYYDFAGWYTYDGTRIYDSTTFTGSSDVTLYAHWNEHSPSGWVEESSVPYGAKVVEEKWTYDLITRTTSGNNYMPGYTLYDTTWVWSDYGSWSGWQNDAVYASESRDVTTRYIEPTYKTQYNYNRWKSNSGYNWGPCAGTWSGVYCGNYEERGWSDTPLPFVVTRYSGQYGGNYNTYGDDGANAWYNEWTQQVQTGGGYYQYAYRDRYKIYTYYFQKVESKESSTQVTASNTVTNVKRWVRYRAK